MRRILFSALVGTCVGIAVAQDPSIERITPRANAVLADDAKVETFVTCCKWAEGPVVAPNGDLILSDTEQNSILEISPGGVLSVFKHPSGNTDPNFKGKEPGTNGDTFDSQGRLTVAGHSRRDVFRFDSFQSNAPVTVLTNSYQGKKLNSPNDLVYTSDGSLYFTDPPYGLATQSDKDPAKQLPFNGVYLLRHAAQRAAGSAPEEPVLLVRDLTRPNGIAVSPDEKYLYVSNSDPNQRVWMRYPRNADGSIGKGEVFLDAQNFPGQGIPDGMKVDSEGNLYSAGPGGLWIISPEGVHIATIHTGEKVANCAWGGPDHRTLYIASTTKVYRLRVEVPGFIPSSGK